MALLCKHGTRLTLKCFKCEDEGATLRDRLDVGLSLSRHLCKHGRRIMSAVECPDCKAEHPGFAASEASEYSVVPSEYAFEPGFNNDGSRRIPDWDHYHMTMARVAALRSKDRSTQIGCVIVGRDNATLSTGYNSFPAGIDDTAPERHERPEKYFWTEHAERNAIYLAARRGTPLEGSTLYCTWVPCMDCGRAIVQAGITHVFGYAMRLDDPKWKADFDRVVTLFKEAAVNFRIFPTLDEINLSIPS
jgi:dCMP deaminase